MELNVPTWKSVDVYNMKASLACVKTGNFFPNSVRVWENIPINAYNSVAHATNFLFFQRDDNAVVCFLIFNKCGFPFWQLMVILFAFMWLQKLWYVVLMLIFHIFRISSETSTETNEIDPDASTSKLMLSADFFLLGVSFKDTYFTRLRWILVLYFQEIRKVLISIQFIINHQLNFLIYVSNLPPNYMPPLRL